MRLNKWQTAFIIQSGFFLYCVFSLVESRHEANRLERQLTRTVEECGETWINSDVKNIERFIIKK